MGCSGLGRLAWESGSGLQVQLVEVLESGQARMGCGSGLLDQWELLLDSGRA